MAENKHGATHTAAQECLMRLPAAPLQPDHLLLLLLRMRYLRRAQPDPGCPQPAQVRSRRQPRSSHARLRRRRRSLPADSPPCSAQPAPHETEERDAERRGEETHAGTYAQTLSARRESFEMCRECRGGRGRGHAWRSRDETRSTCGVMRQLHRDARPPLKKKEEEEANCLRAGF